MNIIHYLAEVDASDISCALPQVHIHNSTTTSTREPRFSILYLTTVSAGGTTWVPFANCRNQNRTASCCGEYGLRVRPVKGSLLVVHDATRAGVVDTLSAHAGCSDNDREKFIWVEQR